MELATGAGAEERREALLRMAFEKGLNLEATLHGCDPCCFLAVQETLETLFETETSKEAVFKASSALSGGVGRSTEGHCGALSGGVLAIGLRFGRDFSGQESPGSYAACLNRSALRANALQKKFEAAYGSVVCREIHGQLFGRAFRLEDEVELRQFVALQTPDKCPTVVGNGARWAVEIILEEEAKDFPCRF